MTEVHSYGIHKYILQKSNKYILVPSVKLSVVGRADIIYLNVTSSPQHSYVSLPPGLHPLGKSGSEENILLDSHNSCSNERKSEFIVTTCKDKSTTCDTNTCLSGTIIPLKNLS